MDNWKENVLERHEAPPYEEMALYYPQPNQKRPLILAGAPGIGRHELRQRLLEDTNKFAAPVPRHHWDWNSDGSARKFPKLESMSLQQMEDIVTKEVEKMTAKEPGFLESFARDLSIGDDYRNEPSNIGKLAVLKIHYILETWQEHRGREATPKKMYETLLGTERLGYQRLLDELTVHVQPPEWVFNCLGKKIEPKPRLDVNNPKKVDYEDVVTLNKVVPTGLEQASNSGAAEAVRKMMEITMKDILNMSFYLEDRETVISEEEKCINWLLDDYYNTCEHQQLDPPRELNRRRKGMSQWEKDIGTFMNLDVLGPTNTGKTSLDENLLFQAENEKRLLETEVVLFSGDVGDIGGKSAQQMRDDVASVQELHLSNDFEIVTHEDCTKLEEAYSNGGMQGLKRFVDKELNSWMNTPVNIAVTGQSGSGKSSFINAVRGMEDDEHPDFAPVGITECTTKPKSYPFPNNRSIQRGMPNVEFNQEVKDEIDKLESFNVTCFDVGGHSEFFLASHSAVYIGTSKTSTTSTGGTSKTNEQGKAGMRQLSTDKLTRKWAIKQDFCSFVEKIIACLVLLSALSSVLVAAEDGSKNYQFTEFQLFKATHAKESVLLPPFANGGDGDYVCQLRLLIEIGGNLGKNPGKTIFIAEHPNFGSGPLKFTMTSDGRRIWREQKFCLADCANAAKTPLLLSATTNLTEETNIRIVPELRNETCEGITNPSSRPIVLGLIFSGIFLTTVILLQLYRNLEQSRNRHAKQKPIITDYLD